MINYNLFLPDNSAFNWINLKLVAGTIWFFYDSIRGFFYLAVTWLIDIQRLNFYCILLPFVDKLTNFANLFFYFQMVSHRHQITQFSVPKIEDKNCAELARDAVKCKSIKNKYKFFLNGQMNTFSHLALKAKDWKKWNSYRSLIVFLVSFFVFELSSLTNFN